MTSAIRHWRQVVLHSLVDSDQSFFWMRRMKFVFSELPSEQQKTGRSEGSSVCGGTAARHLTPLRRSMKVCVSSVDMRSCDLWPCIVYHHRRRSMNQLWTNSSLLTSDPEWPHVYCQHIPHIPSPRLPGGQSRDQTPDHTRHAIVLSSCFQNKSTSSSIWRTLRNKVMKTMVSCYLEEKQKKNPGNRVLLLCGTSTFTGNRILLLCSTRTFTGNSTFTALYLSNRFPV